MKTKFRILIPVRLNDDNGRAGIVRQRKFLQEITDIDLSIPLSNCGDITFTGKHIKLRSGFPEYGKRLIDSYRNSSFKYDHIELMADIGLNKAFLTTYLTEPMAKELMRIPGRYIRSIAIEWMCIEFIFGVKHALLAANISYPSYVTTDKGAIYVNGKLQEYINPGYQFFDSVVEESKERGWPPIAIIPFSKTWEWCRKIPGFLAGEGKSKCGRALAALSYTFREMDIYDPGLDIIWALMGLEALYCKGNAGLQMQLQEKTASFLGKMETFKKEFNQLYDFRSRLIHGDIDLPFMHLHLENKGPFARRLEDKTHIGMALLISTLQTMIKLNLHDIDFVFTLVN